MPITLTRSILAILLPGFLATSPYLVYYFSINSTPPPWLKSSEIAIYTIFFVAAVIAGKLFESITAHIEVKLDSIEKCTHKEAESKVTEASEHWHYYLCYQFDKNEPVMYRYIGDKFSSMYFEFNTSIALIFFSYGLKLNSTQFTTNSWPPSWAIVLSSWVLSAWFFRQGLLSHSLLSKSRKEWYMRSKTTQP